MTALEGPVDWRRADCAASASVCFSRFLEAADNKSKIWVVRLLTSLLMDACPPKVVNNPRHADIPSDDVLNEMFTLLLL